MRLFEKMILILAFILLIPFVYAKNCIDNDDGLKYYEASNVTFYGEDYRDRCVNDKILIEGYCDKNDNLVLTSYDCSPGSCYKGACIPTTTTTITTTTTTTSIPILTVETRVDVTGNYIDMPIEVDADRKFTDGGVLIYPLLPGIHTINAFDYNSREFSHFWDQDCDGNGNWIDAFGPYNFMMYENDRNITALYRVFTKILNLNYDGKEITGELLDEENYPIIEWGCSHSICSNPYSCEKIIYPNSNVNLYYYDGSWKNIGSVDSLENGSFSHNWVCPTGTTKIKAEYTPSEENWFYSSNTIEEQIICDTTTTISTTTTTTTSTITTTTESGAGGGSIGTTITTTSTITTTTSTTTTTTITGNTTTTQVTTTTTGITTTTLSNINMNIVDLSLSCNGSPNHGCSELIDIDSINNFTVPDSADCGDSIEVKIKWTGWHGYVDNTEYDHCEENYWGFFLETSPSNYYFLGSCQSFNSSDCSLSESNTYVMKYNVKMPDKGTITDGTYNIFVTGETYGGYCYPDELNVDDQISVPINLKNCGKSSSTPTTTTKSVSSSTTTQRMTTTQVSGLSTTTVRSGPHLEITTTFSGISTTTTLSSQLETIKKPGGGGGGNAYLLNLNNVIIIALIIALAGLAIIFSVMKLTRKNSVEPTPRLDEENNEKTFY